ncbi:MAG TPA: nucleotide pyrophosphohydrolase [Phycisphaerae bacterium]|nr:nucleotide pyrophosphohydrolase [Phycisphaerae bacterium]
MTDADTTLRDLRETVRRFVDERDWNQFHDPKNLSMAIATEAAELMEHFRWLTGPQARELRNAPSDLQEVREELADILCFTLSFANALDIDLSTALREKMLKNAEKYPADRFRGRFR